MQHPGDTSAPSVRRQPTSLILGILCLVLLMATGVLGYLGEKCPARWVVHKDSSYLFSPEKGTWEKCHSSCISQSAQLLTTEGGEELDFIKKESFHYFEDHDGVTQYHTFWIGLSYDPGSRKWVWADDSDLSSGLFDLQDLSHQNDQDRVCAYIEGGRAKAGGICRETHFCICEKRRKEPVGTH
ncbi:C-type lectin domain family 7 member A-like isoform X1 [Alligator sinensis]|uniref:C-type lectin domain family 7 member A-like isoform X1 n=1 Tax=Alligator sinensis TaxID=38654 RepID=A0A3Q0FV08_ALLSI|nr:C-type lectin domain family 7 member A-like isoform X1 [Alligator sinensis]